MPQPQHAADAPPGPEDAGGHDGRAGAAQGRAVEASAGGGMVTVDDHRRPRVKDDHDRPRRDRSRGPRDAAGHGARRGQRGDRARPRSSPRRKMGGLTGGMDLGGGLGPAGPAGMPALYAPPVQRLITELGKLPGIGARTAQRLAFHILRADAGGRQRARRRDPRGQGADRAVRGLLQPRRRARAAGSASTSAATRR